MGAINEDDDEEDDDDDDDESDDAGGPPLRYSYSHSCPGSRGRRTPKWPTPRSCP